MSVHKPIQLNPIPAARSVLPPVTEEDMRTETQRGTSLEWSATMTGPGSGPEARRLRDFLREVPDTARVRISGPSPSPRDDAYWSITATWAPEAEK